MFDARAHGRAVSLSIVLVAASTIGCEAIAGYDSREPWPEDASGIGPAGDPDALAPDSTTDSATGADTAPADSESDAGVSCLAPKTRCDDACVDLATSLEHCGRCGNHCPDGATCAPSGVGFECACPVGRTSCGAPGPRRCVDTASAHDDCGACGVKCKHAEACVAGECVCLSGTLDCGGKCVDPRCDPVACGGCGVACSSIQYCAGDTGCACRPGLQLCAGECVDTRGDPRHCGGCGKPCSGSASCRDGSCKPNCAGSTACDVGGVQHCVSTSTDPRHCGGCGKACAVTELCVGGACVGYAPAVGCTSCPCATCDEIAGGATCCAALPGQPAPICVSGSTCP